MVRGCGGRARADRLQHGLHLHQAGYRRANLSTHRTPAQVQILRTVPTRPHVRLGEVTAEPSSDSVPVTEIEAACAKPQQMGADAAVVVYDKTQTTGAYVTGPWWGRQVQAVRSGSSSPWPSYQ